MEKHELIFDFVKRHIYYLLGGLCLLVVGVIYFAAFRQTTAGDNENTVLFIPAATEESAALEQEPHVLPPLDVPNEIIVHVVGAVNNPGVFALNEGARINDVITLAGGAKRDADLARINLAALAVDAMQIIVPFVGEYIDEVFVFSGEPPGGNAQAGGLININTASSTELQTLPGIGPALSEAIINFRNTHGNFQTVDELINVPRIGPATLERLRPLVDVR